MGNYLRKFIKNLILFFVTGFILRYFRVYVNYDWYRFLLRGGDFGAKLEYMWVTSRVDLIRLIIHAILVLILVLSVINMFVYAIKGALHAGEEDSPVSSKGGSYTSARNSAKVRSSKSAKTTAQGQAITCDHKLGKDKYIEQLDRYLRDNVIVKSEYDTLKERYKRVNVPNDYH